MPRVNTYLSDAELLQARDIAEREGAALSAVIRYAVRRLLGMSVPPGWLRYEADYADERRERLTP
jgi:hypothetical protein